MRSSAPEPKVSPTTGDILAGQYRVEGVLGSGGMGTVYAVVDTASGDSLALKVVGDTTDREHVTRFFREGRATVRIESEHVVRVFDVGSIDGKLPYMVMERLAGTTLKAVLRAQGPLDERTVADLMIQACEGLAHAHASGIVHRDIKPSNLFVLDDDGPRLKILDFGISKIASLEDWERTTTESGAFLGSPYYVSPEQLKNPSKIDQRADVWSLGVTMYNALSGRHPFEGGSLAELLVTVMSGTPAPLGPTVRASTAMRSVVSRCLERVLDRRFHDAGDVALALAPLASPRWAALAKRVASIAGTQMEPRPQLPARARDDEHTMTFDEPTPAVSLRPEDTLTFEGGARTPPTTPSRVPNDATIAHAPSYVPPPVEPLRSRPVASGAPPSRRPLGIALMILTALAIAGVAAALTRSQSSAPATPSTTVEPPPAVTASAMASASAPAPAPSGTMAASDPTEITLELGAQGPITKVIRPSARRVALEDGKARVTVAPFRGELPIEVEVAGKGLARGVAREGGPTTIRLSPVKPVLSGRPPSRPKGSSELQGSPYQ